VTFAALERDPSPAPRLALDVYCDRVAQAVAAMATALGGLDALAFTAGVGEHSALVREQIVACVASMRGVRHASGP
jgi:acetate kinase